MPRAVSFLMVTAGWTEEAWHILSRIGGRRLGAPSAAVTKAVRGAGDIERLETAVGRVPEVENRDELLPL